MQTKWGFRPLRLSMQYFADGAEGTGDNGGEGDQHSGTTGAENNASGADQNNQDENVNARLDRIVQAQVDKLMAEERKKTAFLHKQNEQLKKDKMTADELREFELKQREASLLEQQKTLQDRENRLYAIKAIKTTGLDDGSDRALEIVDFVMADDQKDIDTRVKSFNSLVQALVKAQVDKTFKVNGRNPNARGGSSGTDQNDNSIAAELGKRQAERMKASDEVFKHYL